MPKSPAESTPPDLSVGDELRTPEECAAEPLPIPPGENTEFQQSAAVLIQSAYKGYRTRKTTRPKASRSRSPSVTSAHKRNAGVSPPSRVKQQRKSLAKQRGGGKGGRKAEEEDTPQNEKPPPPPVMAEGTEKGAAAFTAGFLAWCNAMGISDQDAEGAAQAVSASLSVALTARPKGSELPVTLAVVEVSDGEDASPPTSPRGGGSKKKRKSFNKSSSFIKSPSFNRGVKKSPSFNRSPSMNRSPSLSPKTAPSGKKGPGRCEQRG
eukprot:Hpha_TRINITY_DN24296_c0_g1::TRINITY_DN24296_c0_g1_i1::g.36076::m.36076